MKKIIISAIAFLLGIGLCVVLILCFSNKTTHLSITSYDEVVTIDLGKYKVKDYNKTKFDGSNPMISFKVNDEVDFYNSIIKQSEFYDEELIINTKKHYVYGYMVKENRLFSYSINNNVVEICSKEGAYDKNKNTYFIFAPLFPALNDSKLTDTTDDYYQKFMDEYITFDVYKKIIKKIDQTFYKIEDDVIYFKGLSGMDLIYDKYVISDEYLLKFYEYNDGIKVQIIED